MSQNFKSSSWSSQEQLYLRQLRQQQKKQNQVNWKLIANLINYRYSKDRNAKQCRQRYINYLNFQQKSQLCLEWSRDEVVLLSKLYTQHGSSWQIIASFLKNKSENSIKNKFNSLIRRGAKSLCECETEIKNKKTKTITAQLLISMIDLSNKIYPWILASSLNSIQQSFIFKFRAQILQLCFQTRQFTKDQLYDLVVLIKTFNSKLRSFGFYKTKYRKQWKITQKFLESIFQFDKLTNQQMIIGQSTSCSVTVLMDSLKLTNVKKIYTSMLQQQNNSNLESTQFQLLQIQSEIPKNDKEKQNILQQNEFNDCSLQFIGF